MLFPPTSSACSSVAYLVESIQEISGLTVEEDVVEVCQVTADRQADHPQAARRAAGRRGHDHPGPRQEQRSSPSGSRRPWRTGPSTPLGRTSPSRSRTPRATTVRRIQLMQGWASKWEGPSLKAGESSAATETVTLVVRGDHGRMRRTVTVSNLTSRSRHDAWSTPKRQQARTPPLPPPRGPVLRTEFDFELPRGYVDDGGHRAPARVDAPGHGPRRAAARRSTCGSRRTRLPERGAAQPGDHRARHGQRSARRGGGADVRHRHRLPAGLLPARQQRGAHPGGVSPARPAAPRSRSTSQAGAWGNRDVRADRLLEEIAYMAYHFHWPREEILDLDPPRAPAAGSARSHASTPG